MNVMYLHLDRIGQLKNGDVVKLQKQAGASKLSVLAGMFCEGFIEHLDGMCRDGLSYHGVSYLIRNFEPQRTVRADLLMAELHLEFVRWQNKIDEPSRFRSLFAFTDKEDALKFAQDNKAYPTIYEVEPLGRFFEADMDLSRRPDYALQYWQGENLCNSTRECVLELPVRVIRPMKLIPTFTFEEE